MLDPLSLWEVWCGNPLLAWGLGPYLSANLGTWPLIVFLEWYAARPETQRFAITWRGGKGGETRQEATEKMHQQIPLGTQVPVAMSTILGPTALVASLAASLLFNGIMPRTSTSTELPSWGGVARQFMLMQLIGDLGLYIGHRIQHEIPYLWEHYHSLHHKLETPTPVGTMYIHAVDATLQASLPILSAASVVRPHILAFYLYTITRVAENVLNHSGLEGTWLDVVFLKFSFLGRASVSHHDAHHKFGGRSGVVTNLGENFWIWDWMFGTLANHRGMRKFE